MRSRVRRLLAKYDYPPDLEEKALELVLEQAAVFAAGVADEHDPLIMSIQPIRDALVRAGYESVQLEPRIPDAEADRILAGEDD